MWWVLVLIVIANMYVYMLGKQLAKLEKGERFDEMFVLCNRMFKNKINSYIRCYALHDPLLNEDIQNNRVNVWFGTWDPIDKNRQGMACLVSKKN